MGCGSSNPCLYCPLERRKVGGVARWQVEEVELRSIGSLNMNYAGWSEEGQREGAQYTREFKSVCAGPILVEGVGDDWNTLVLDKCPPSSLHLFLALNDPINHLERQWPDFKMVLLQLFGIKAHSYQGKERNYQGPELRKMLSGIHKLYPQMRADPVRKLFLDVFIMMKKVNDGIFDLYLDPEWEQIIGQLRAALLALDAAVSFPITPKFHIILEHVPQWVQRNGRSLGKEAEHAAGPRVYIFQELRKCLANFVRIHS